MPSASRAPTPPSTYHHGDLRAALVAAALHILEAEGLGAMSLRAVARAVGVSQTAPYRHFPDRRALVGAVAAEGFRRLEVAMQRAMASNAGRIGFKDVARAYVAFGRANPALYRVMFGPEVADTHDLPELAATSTSALRFVQGGLEQLQAAGLVRAGDASVMATITWASLHGLVSIILDGHSSATREDELLEAITQLVMFGLAPRAPATLPTA
ncbi:MAG: TetR/AcrR family transcriptional regulator [Gemmatimonadaceae bacterium]